MPPLCLASASLSALLPVAFPLAVEELDALPLLSLIHIWVAHETPGNVIRRVGGLEDYSQSIVNNSYVIRRVGGLEAILGASAGGVSVIRRVGGLEVLRRFAAMTAAVIRRVGGLEVKAGQRLPVVAVIRRVDGLEVISFWSKVSSSDMVPPHVHVELKYPR